MFGLNGDAVLAGIASIWIGESNSNFKFRFNIDLPFDSETGSFIENNWLCLGLAW